MPKKYVNRIKIVIFAALLLFVATVFSGVYYVSYNTPDNFSRVYGKELKIESKIPIRVSENSDKELDVNANVNDKNFYSANIKLMGIFPVKTVNVSVIKEEDVLVLGKPFGIKIYTDGVLVVKIDSVDTESGNKSPAKAAGIQVGDYIITVCGERVNSNEDVARLVEKSGGEKIAIVLRRNNKKMTVVLKPELSYSSGEFKAGVWVKDSSAGVGTLSFYSPSLGVVAGLGHAVCDSETGVKLSLQKGRLVTATILSIEKGRVGTPGGLVGKFTNLDLGEMLLNTDTGVYAENDIEYLPSDLIKIALRQEVKCGKAKILSTIDGSTPKYYECDITKISHKNTITKNLSIKITDKELLQKTGGIVQGMSGSPIIQNGKLIGAVTHVLVDDPTKGYAIFAENMLETAQSVAENNQLKDAS